MASCAAGLCSEGRCQLGAGSRVGSGGTLIGRAINPFLFPPTTLGPPCQLERCLSRYIRRPALFGLYFHRLHLDLKPGLLRIFAAHSAIRPLVNRFWTSNKPLPGSLCRSPWFIYRTAHHGPSCVVAEPVAAFFRAASKSFPVGLTPIYGDILVDTAISQEAEDVEGSSNFREGRA